MLYVFNPEHEQCLSNGNRNYCPDLSSQKFAQDCASIMRFAGSEEEINVWGWDLVIKHRLLNQGIPEDKLPSDEHIAMIRRLAHRRESMKLGIYLSERLNSPYLSYPAQRELKSVGELAYFIEEVGDVMVKSPWSSSGKGLRRLYRGRVTENDWGRCRKVMEKQGSLIAEELQELALNVGIQLRIKEGKASLANYSIFETCRCAYKDNLLVSDDYVRRKCAEYLPEGLLDQACGEIIKYLEHSEFRFYSGYLGVDTYICRDREGNYLLRPCVEINLRMTMGIVASRVYRHFAERFEDGKYLMETVYAPSSEELRKKLESASEILTEVNESSRYAIIVRPL
ncbi:MAG: hypothetical protein ACI3ZF_06640 [Candidatus Cryptobacteroides sp.]